MSYQNYVGYLDYSGGYPDYRSYQGYVRYQDHS